MEIPDELLCLFSAQIEEQDNTYHLTVPKREIVDGDVERGVAYRVALLGSKDTTDDSNPKPEPTQNQSGPPVAEGDRRSVEIEEIGKHGDGIARVEHGYVIIVPDTEKHDRVTVEITNVAETVAFAEVVERKPYYE
ncbi:TRAM domain-containing protein [Haladaptatus halobius]|uniref:TRAM domain-containing protein n=1 Tax=Haladaptatus halobius TaxID=2884875 RepID=UPI001D0A33AA|nr:TRAM domain-containing protein [Haladaptatus halobius]